MWGLLAKDAQSAWSKKPRVWSKRGCGKAALGHMLDRLALEYPKKPIYLSVIPGNDAAIRLYRGAGFRFTGEKDVHGEDVMRLAYPERNS